MWISEQTAIISLYSADWFLLPRRRVFLTLRKHKHLFAFLPSYGVRAVLFGVPRDRSFILGPQAHRNLRG